MGQKEIEKMSDTILQKDSLFWSVYNTCTTDRYKKFFSEDVEFYHDKGGMMHGLDSLVASAKRNLCGINNFRLRREAVEGSVKVFPLQEPKRRLKLSCLIIYTKYQLIHTSMYYIVV